VLRRGWALSFAKMQKESEFRPYGVDSQARPHRLAFLIDPDDCAVELLDTIFATNYGLWGGRLNPLIPVRKAEISEKNWELLRYTDPDTIYTFVPLPSTLINRLDEEIAPLTFEAHHLQVKQSPPFYPAMYSQTQIRSREILPLLLSGPPLRGHKAQLLKYAENWKWQHRRFVARNFGILNEGWFRAIPEGTDSLSIQSSWDRAELLEHLARCANLIFPFQAAEALSGFPAPAVASQPNYCLLIGDSAETWIHFWNRVFHLPHYIRAGWNTLCLPKEALDDESLHGPLREFVKRFTHRSSSQSPDLAVESFECEEGELEGFAKKVLRQLDVIPRVRRLNPDEAPTPDHKDHFPPRWGSAPVTHQQATTSSALLSPPASAVPLNTGTWVMDLQIQHIPRFQFYTDEVLSWMLPRRFGVADAFVQGHSSRINRAHSVSVAMAHSGPFNLRRPQESEMLLRALGAVRTREYSEDFKVKEMPPRFGRIDSSDKALYVNGIIELFGGLQQAGQVLRHSFWRDIFERLSKRGPTVEAKLVQRVRNKLDKRREAIASQLSSGASQPIEWLSNLVIQLSREGRSDEADITFAEIKEDFHAQREQYIAANPDFRPKVSNEDITRDHEEVTQRLKSAVQGLTNAGVLIEGIRVRCANCGSGYWRDIGSLRQTTSCDGCQTLIYTPVEATWRYRLNSLVRNGIALHGCLPVIAALHDLRQKAREGFVYTPGVALFRNWEDEEPEAETDILCIADGHLVCGEVKSSASEFTSAELRKLAAIALKIRADIVVISAFRDEKGVMGKIVLQLLAMVRPGCAVTSAGPSGHDFDPNPHP